MAPRNRQVGPPPSAGLVPSADSRAIAERINGTLTRDDYANMNWDDLADKTTDDLGLVGTLMRQYKGALQGVFLVVE